PSLAPRLVLTLPTPRPLCPLTASPPPPIPLLFPYTTLFRSELTAAGLDSDIWQCPVVLLADVRSVGVQDEGRSYGYPVVLRPVSDRKSTRLNSSHVSISYAVFCLKKQSYEVHSSPEGVSRHQ